MISRARLNLFKQFLQPVSVLNDPLLQVWCSGIQLSSQDRISGRSTFLGELQQVAKMNRKWDGKWSVLTERYLEERTIKPWFYSQVLSFSFQKLYNFANFAIKTFQVSIYSGLFCFSFFRITANIQILCAPAKLERLTLPALITAGAQCLENSCAISSIVYLPTVMPTVLPTIILF